MSENKLKKIKLLLLDVDGVLTDGSIIYTDSGEEIKQFDVKDGLGIRLLIEAGIKVAIISGRSSQALAKRCNNLGIKYLFDGRRNKAESFGQILKQVKVLPEEIAFICDDLPDMSLMKKVGLSIAVSDACDTIINKADMITKAKGGKGAVREVCDSILKAQGHWQNIIEHFP